VFAVIGAARRVHHVEAHQKGPDMKTSEHASTNLALEPVATDHLAHVTGGGWKGWIKKWARGRKIDKDIERHGERPSPDGQWRPA
jgi:hypothetical protein